MKTALPTTLLLVFLAAPPSFSQPTITIRDFYDEIQTAFPITSGINCLIEGSNSTNNTNAITSIRCSTPSGSRSVGLSADPSNNGTESSVVTNFRTYSGEGDWSIQASANLVTGTCNVQVNGVACRDCEICTPLYADQGPFGLTADCPMVEKSKSAEQFQNETCVDVLTLMIGPNREALSGAFGRNMVTSAALGIMALVVLIL